MTAAVSPSSSSPATPPAPAVSPSLPTPNPSSHPTGHPTLPPLVTSPPGRRTVLPRPMSHASKNRLSQYSTGSLPPRSRPISHVFPVYPSSLPYTQVRDFAYPTGHPLHYGAPLEPSRPPSDIFIPAFDGAHQQRRLSDPPMPWESRTSWDSDSWTSDGPNSAGFIAPIHPADGPPWSEDEDLQSPVVSSRHRKHKSPSSGGFGHGRSHNQREANVGRGAVGGEANNRTSSGFLVADNYDRERGYYVDTGGDGSERYYVNQGSEANGPGGEYVTYPPDQARHGAHVYPPASQQQPRQYGEFNPASDASSPISSPDYRDDDQSRYSRDYQFTITSPDEEMHGKAVALFDFESENENELPLVEGQIIWVSYRHGQGWLVAMDPKTQESGLVPEEYVRLLRDIEGGMNSLTGQLANADGSGSPNDGGGTPTQAEHQEFAGLVVTGPPSVAGASGGGSGGGGVGGNGNGTSSGSSSDGGPGGSAVVSAGHTPTPSSVSNGYHQPIVSTFSTSSKDLDPYPPHLLGTQARQTPPQVIHYHGQRGGSQANTPTLLNHQDVGMMRRGSQDLPAKKGEPYVQSSLEALPDADADAEEAGETKQ